MKVKLLISVTNHVSLSAGRMLKIKHNGRMCNNWNWTLFFRSMRYEKSGK